MKSTAKFLKECFKLTEKCEWCPLGYFGTYQGYVQAMRRLLLSRFGVRHEKNPKANKGWRTKKGEHRWLTLPSEQALLKPRMQKKWRSAAQEA